MLGTLILLKSEKSQTEGKGGALGDVTNRSKARHEKQAPIRAVVIGNDGGQIWWTWTGLHPSNLDGSFEDGQVQYHV